MDCKHYSSNLQALLNHMRNYGWDKKAQKLAEALSKEESVLFVHVVSTFLDEYDWKRYRTTELNSLKRYLDEYFEVVELMIFYPFVVFKWITRLILLITAFLIIVSFIASH